MYFILLLFWKAYVEAKKRRQMAISVRHFSHICVPSVQQSFFKTRTFFIG